MQPETIARQDFFLLRERQTHRVVRDVGDLRQIFY